MLLSIGIVRVITLRQLNFIETSPYLKQEV
jgi:hypothetical protein